MGNTQSTKPKRPFLQKYNRNSSGTTHKDGLKRTATNLTQTSSKTTGASSTSTVPIKPTNTDNSLYIYDDKKSNILGIHSINNSSLPPSPTHSDNKATTEILTIHGRTYQNKNKKYILPSDAEEQDRLVQVHFMYKYMFGANFSAPVRDLLLGSYNSKGSPGIPPRVLDIACGNGTWILEMATEFPDSQFYGIDFDPNYPTTVKPSNTFFSQHDVLSPKGLPFPDDYFDYVYMRHVYTCFSESDWTVLVKEIKRVVKPSGYVEFREIDPMLKNMGPLTTNLFKAYPFMMKERQGVNIYWSRYMFEYLQNVGGFTDMYKQVKSSRLGSIAGPIGDMARTLFRSALESHRLFFMNCCASTLTDAEYDQLVDNIVDETIKRHSFFNYYSCWGRKPLFDYQHQPQKETNTTTTIPTTPPVSDNIEVASPNRHSSSSSATLPFLYTITSSDHDISNTFMPTLSSFAWKDKTDDDDDFASLGSENVSDIDQFIEGFED